MRMQSLMKSRKLKLRAINLIKHPVLLLYIPVFLNFVCSRVCHYQEHVALNDNWFEWHRVTPCCEQKEN
jgi:hypothetical protein